MCNQKKINVFPSYKFVWHHKGYFKWCWGTANIMLLCWLLSLKVITFDLGLLRHRTSLPNISVESTPKTDTFSLIEASDPLVISFSIQEESRAFFSLCPIQGPKDLQDFSDSISHLLVLFYENAKKLDISLLVLGWHLPRLLPKTP